MENRQGFYSIEPLNNGHTRIGLMWNNTIERKFYNETVSREIIDVKKFPDFLAHVITRDDVEEVARELLNNNNIKECAVIFENLNYNETMTIQG
ncbi:hypothetical protein [Sporosarcina sp. FSL W7-1283]|uniref:hypothetical protein n=1 Tax=Sporosarcina sp. FSL W7-1283 TaxID=2921560 RepID=UPI0030F61128